MTKKSPDKKTTPAKSEKPKTDPGLDRNERIEIKITTRSAVPRDKQVTVYEAGTRIELTRAELDANKLADGSYEVLGA